MQRSIRAVHRRPTRTISLDLPSEDTKRYPLTANPRHEATLAGAPLDIKLMIIDLLLSEAVTAWNHLMLNPTQSRARIRIHLDRVNQEFRRVVFYRYWTIFSNQISPPCERVLAYKCFFTGDRLTEHEVLEWRVAQIGRTRMDVIANECWDAFRADGSVRCLCDGTPVELVDFPIEMR